MKNLKLTRRQTADSVSSGVSLCGCYVIPEFFIRAVAALISQVSISRSPTLLRCPLVSRLEDGPEFSLADWHICFCSASSSLFWGCGGREAVFRDWAQVKTVNGQIVLRPVIQGKALSTTPVTSARERSLQYNTNLVLIAQNLWTDHELCFGAHQ